MHQTRQLNSSNSAERMVEVPPLVYKDPKSLVLTKDLVKSKAPAVYHFFSLVPTILFLFRCAVPVFFDMPPGTMRYLKLGQSKRNS